MNKCGSFVLFSIDVGRIGGWWRVLFVVMRGLILFFFEKFSEIDFFVFFKWCEIEVSYYV